MAPAIIEVGPASGPEVSLETKEVSVYGAETAIDPNHEEYQYLHLIRRILDQGEHRPDRYAASATVCDDIIVEKLMVN